MSDGRDHYEVLWPRAERDTLATPLAPRLRDLAGKRVAFLWDYVFKGDVVFAQLAADLAQRYGGVSFVDWSEFGNTHGQDERRIVAGLPERLRALDVDAVVSAMGC